MPMILIEIANWPQIAVRFVLNQSAQERQTEMTGKLWCQGAAVAHPGLLADPKATSPSNENRASNGQLAVHGAWSSWGTSRL